VDIKALPERSFRAARSKPIEAASEKELHQRRSREWVEALADGFRDHYQSDSTVRVFSKHNPSTRVDFGLNELLYDILVCRVGTVQAARHRKDLLYIREALWQVESEFARDSRQALIDFNKLVLGAANSKLFVGPQVSDCQSFLGVLLPAARACGGNVYASLIPHPSEWERGDYHIQVWRLEGEQWALFD